MGKSLIWWRSTTASIADCLSADEVSITSVTAIMNLYSRLVQLVERLTVNQEVTGSSPVSGAKSKCSFIW